MLETIITSPAFTWILAALSLPVVVLLWFSPVFIWMFFQGDYEWQRKRRERKINHG